MDDQARCPYCQTPLPGDAIHGVCPRCVGRAFLSLPLAEGEDSVVTEQPGDCIGPYKLLQLIGEGGCGLVYLAEQDRPIRRQVALKVIKLGMDTRRVIARFEAERQALALMDHPNIAKVLEGGSTASGRPYFVMELVRGTRITDYCNQHELSPKERLDLFIQVCQAIQHAHQKGIIHRDIKPSNVLVALQDGVPVPKVIDFGIAKATEQRLTEKTLFTALEQFVGTPAYMSPEQAELSGLDVDTRSDIYSLGVLLYELLTGRTPFDVQELLKQGVDALRQAIREQEPVRPSTKLRQTEQTECGRGSQSPIANRKSKIENDLDWIVMKCLEKDRTRRYETANALAADLHRFLTDEPVLARPPSTVYRFRKALRRNKAMCIAGALVIMTLVAGIVVSSWQAAVATQARNAAWRAQAEKEQEARKAQEERNRALAAQAQADQKATEAQHRLYAADMKLAQQALLDHNLGTAVNLLQRYVPGPASGAEDLRGFEWRYLWRQTRGQELRSLDLSNALVVTGLAFSPDGRWLAVARPDGARIIEVAPWTVRLSLISDEVTAVEYSADGQTLITAGGDEARLWDTRTWQVKAVLKGASDLATFSPDGKTLICDGTEGLQVWDTQPLQLLHTLPLQHVRKQWRSAAKNLAFSGDGQVIAAVVEDSSALASNRTSLRIWQAAELRQKGAAATARDLWLPETAVVLALTLNGDGSQVAVTTTLGYICVLQTSTGALVAHCRETPVRALELLFRPDNVTLVGSSSDQTVCAWRPAGTNLARIGALRGHLAEIRAIAPSPDWRYLASGDFTGGVKLWEASLVEAGSDPAMAQKPAPGLIHSLEFLSDSRTLVGCSLTDASLWDVEAGQPIRVFPDVPWHAAVRVSPNEKWIGLARTNGVVEILDLASSKRMATLVGHTNEVRRILFLPDNRRVLTAAVLQESIEGEYFEPDSFVRLWDVVSGRLLMETNLSAKVHAVALAPDGQTFAVQHNGRVLEIRRTEDFGLVFRRPIPYGPRTQLFYSPDGRVLVFLGSRSNEIGVFDLQTRQFRFNMRGHGMNINGAAFTPNGRTLATSANDFTVRLWSVDTGLEMLKLTLPRSINRVAFSPDGRTLAVGIYWLEGSRTFGEVRFFHAPSLDEIAAIEAKKKLGAEANE